jgi:signal transduction histidine kinase
MKITWKIAFGFSVMIILILVGSIYSITEVNNIYDSQEIILSSTDSLYSASLKEKKVVAAQIMTQKLLGRVQEEMSALLLYMDDKHLEERSRLLLRLEELHNNILAIGQTLQKSVWSDDGKAQVQKILEKQIILYNAILKVIAVSDNDKYPVKITNQKLIEFQAKLYSLNREIILFRNFVDDEVQRQSKNQAKSFKDVRSRVSSSMSSISAISKTSIISAAISILIALIVAVYTYLKLYDYSFKLEQLVDEKTREFKKALSYLKKSQEQLVQSEKMAFLGQLVAGIAHEINTPIGIGVTAASHFLEMTRDMVLSFNNKTARKENLEKYFEKATQESLLILKNLRQTSALIKSFKMVSSDQASEERRKFKIKSYLEDIIFSLRPRLKKTSHNVIINCVDDIELDSFPGAFSQVITNLIMNSLIHAYDEDEQGNITINISNTDNLVTLEYSDDGKGIAQENLKKIYDPFFTTVRSTGGTGLGLHIVYNIVNLTLNGAIECDSVEGQGTTFNITIPIKV